jgi:hypothetical protein
MKSKSNDSVLGIYVGVSQIEAVLLRMEGDRASMVSRFTRQRSAQGGMVSKEALATALPGLRSAEDADFTIQVGSGGGGGGDMFLGSEFGDVEKRGAEHAIETNGNGAKVLAMPFLAQLKEILGECASMGHPQPRLAFCIQPPDVSYATILAQSDDTRKDARKPTAADERHTRKRLLEWLDEQHHAKADRERAAFVEIAPLKKTRRYLAVWPEGREPVTPTVDLLKKQPEASNLRSELIDSELTLLRTLVLNAKGDLAVQEEGTTALVRVGTEDTLVLFFSGRELRHYERLRSLTTYDSPQTVCSRVLLQQDEQKIGAVDRLFVLGEGRSEKLLDGFKSFYEETDVRPISDLLHADGLAAGDDLPHAGTMLAAGVALRLGFGYNGDTGINLMPEKLRKKRKAELSVAWHTLVMLLVLFATTFFFVWSYQSGQAEIRQARADLAANPPPAPLENPAVLQARVDSLQAAYTMYTRSLTTLDSLLVGSDRWSRFLESTSRATGGISGVWINSWNSSGGNVRFDGAATSQTQVALLARRMNGSIEKSSSFEIRSDGRPVRLYNFTMTVPVPVRTPYVAEYLQQVAAGDIDPDHDDVRIRPEEMHHHDDTPMTTAAQAQANQ